MGKQLFEIFFYKYHSEPVVQNFLDNIHHLCGGVERFYQIETTLEFSGFFDQFIIIIICEDDDRNIS